MMIPANSATRHQLERLRVGQVVHLLTRSDTGPVACEVVLVDLADVEPANER